LQAAAFEDSLTGHVILITVGAVPDVAVAFHREPTVQSLDEQIDSVSGELVLGKDAVPFAGDLDEDIHLEPAVEGRRDWVAGTSSGRGTLELGEARRARFDPPLWRPEAGPTSQSF
jgi:hypothetical protein